MSHDDQAARMLEDFALAIGRPLIWSQVARPSEQFARLADGSADIVVGPRPTNLSSHRAIAATAPVATERYVVIGRTENKASNPLELSQMSIAMPLASPLWDYFERLRNVVSGVKLNALSNDLERDAPLRLVADGMVDLAVVPVTGNADWLQDHPRVKPLFNLTDERPLSWYVRRSDTRLLANLDQFIERYHTAYFEPSASLRDFEAIKRRGVLRIITRMEAHNYFIQHGKPSGFELELASAFATKHHLRLEVLVAKDDAQIFEWLKEGAGDLVTARVMGDGIARDPGFRSSKPYHYDAFATVSRKNLVLRSPADLQGLVVAAPEDSAEYRALLSVRPDIPGLTVIAVDPRISRQTLLDRVAIGVVDATVVTGESALTISRQRNDLAIGTSIAHHYQYKWTVRGGDQALLDAADDFLAGAATDGLTNMLAAQFGDKPNAQQPLAAAPTRLSPFDGIVQHYADRYDFDWRLIAAQMYQESQFNPRAVSPSGAQGLMQLMPDTAQALGCGDIKLPEAAIHAGVKYLYNLRNEFDADVPVGERTWFALAAYNTGVQRVERARRLATRLNLDPNRWSGNVEVAMLALARPPVGSPDRRYGQAIVYVRAIQSLYGTYRNLQVSSLPAISIPPRA